MATVKIVPKKDWEVLSKYLFEDNGIVFVPEEKLEDPECFSPENAQAIRDKDGEPVDYDFGGDADIWVDICSSDDHILMDS